MRTIDRAINNTTTAQMGRVSRLALAMASAMTIWHGTAVADSAAPAPSSVAAAASAVGAPYDPVTKQVVAIYQNPNKTDRMMYWWADGSYSDVTRYGALKFIDHYSDQGKWFNERGWPAGKRLAAIYQSPTNNYYDNYYWSDGGYSVWSYEAGRFIEHDDGTGEGSQLLVNKGWPAGKRVAAIYKNPRDQDLISYWWTDGGYSDWSKSKRKFVTHSPDQGKWFNERGWPVGKRLAAIAEYETNIIYWWSDGTYSDWGRSENRFINHDDGTKKWFAEKGWPTIPAFDPSKYEVRDVRVNPYSTGNGVIYANGRMQYKVEVRAQIVDRSTGKGVDLSDLRSGRDSAGQVRDLVTLYLGDHKVDTPGAALAIDNMGNNASSSWKASRTDEGYDKYLNVFAHYSEQIDGSVVEHDPVEHAAYSASDGWNSYVYWVSSTEQTGPDPMRICARVGSYGRGGEGYYDTCSNGRDESAKVRTLPPKRYGQTDYDRLRTVFWVGDMGKFLEYSVSLRGGRIRSANAAPGSVITVNNDLPCISAENDSWYRTPDEKWNSNTALYMVNFGANMTNGPVAKNLLDDSDISIPREGLNSNVITLIETHGNIAARGASSDNIGTWSNCLKDKAKTEARSGGISFIDSYGNAGTMRFAPDNWDFWIY